MAKKSEFQKQRQKKMDQLAFDCLERLSSMGYSMRDVEKLMDGRVSYRTLYRWYQGNSVQRESDVLALKELYIRLMKKDRKSRKRNQN